MNPEQIQDALHYLNEDMIGAVDALRKNRRNRLWRRWGAMAACLCLAVVGTVLVWHSGLLHSSGTEVVGVPTVQTEQETMAPPNQNGLDSAPDTMGNVTDVPTGQAPSVLVCIETWEYNGFSGRVMEDEITGNFQPGQTLTVKFSEHVGIEYVDGEFASFVMGAPTPEMFPEGTVVRVRFDETKPETVQSGAAGTVVYGMSITPVE